MKYQYQIGGILKAEMKESWLLFEFLKLELCSDPQDMFFGVVKPVKQFNKRCY